MGSPLDRWLRAGCSLLLGALATLGALGSGCNGPIRRSDGMVRFRGPVRVALTAAIVAPGTDAGKPWDGLGTLPPETVSGLREIRPKGLIGDLFRAAAEGTGAAVVASLLPWTVNTIAGAYDPPDTFVEVRLNGSKIKLYDTVSDSYYPTWSTTFSDAIEIGEFDQLEFSAVDKDALSKDDQVGVCTTQGMPWIDPRGYATADTFLCSGQLLAIALRVIPAPAPAKPSK